MQQRQSIEVAETKLVSVLQLLNDVDSLKEIYFLSAA